MTAACYNPGHGLITGHAYTLLGALRLEDGESNGVRLLKMRNPWGSEKYVGPWGDADSRWTADYKRQAGAGTNGAWVAADDGAFYIPVEDFIR